MSKRTPFLVTAALSFIMPLRPLAGQALAAILPQLQSTVDTVRINAFERLVRAGQTNHAPVCSPQAGDDIKQALIAALLAEDARVYGNALPGSLSEEEVDDYYGNLVGCVASLHDPHAVNALLGALPSGGGAIGGLLALGDAAVPGLIERLQSKDGNAGISAFMALTQLTSQQHMSSLSPSSIEAVENALLGTLKNASPWVRGDAVKSLESFSDPQVRSAMQHLALTDPYMVTRAGQPTYPVREAAQEWMRQDSVKARKASPQ